MNITRNAKRLPFATIMAARNYGLDNIIAPKNAAIGSKLCMAVIRNDNSEVARLLNLTNEIDFQDLPDGWTPLIYSIYYGNTRARNIFISRGADLEKPDFSGRTPLMFAAIRGDIELIRYLIKRKVNIRTKDLRNKNAFDFAREYHHTACAELLSFYLN